MRIAEVSRQAGVGVETVRFYESRGLIRRPPRPATGGYREYSEDTVRRIRFVRRAQRLGFSLSGIIELLELETVPGARCIDVRERAIAKLADVETKLERLGRIKGALEELVRACPGQGPAKRCSILAAIKSGDLHLEATGKEE
ncbi:MAG TPA: MerR family transcriptional regulator [Alphaproteobacteria bacterium]